MDKLQAPSLGARGLEKKEWSRKEGKDELRPERQEETQEQQREEQQEKREKETQKERPKERQEQSEEEADWDDLSDNREERQEDSEEEGKERKDSPDCPDESVEKSADEDGSDDDAPEALIWNSAKTLALTASTLPEFATSTALGKNCLHIGLPRALKLDAEQRNPLRDAAEAFLWTVPRPTGATEHGGIRTRRMKSQQEIMQGWSVLFDWRRTVQSNDALPLSPDDVHA